MVLSNDMLPEFDCNRQIGKEKYQFFFPVEIGSRFVVQIWTRNSKVSSEMEWSSSTTGLRAITKDSGIRYALTIFENGQRVSSRDSRIRIEQFAEKLSKSWSEEVFSKEEVDDILECLCRLSDVEEKKNKRR